MKPTNPDYPLNLLAAISAMQESPGLYVIETATLPGHGAVALVGYDGIIRAVNPAQELHPDHFHPSAVIKKLTATAPQLWAIWSIEHTQWWRADGQGYTDDRVEAGLYTTQAAIEIVRKANQYASEPNEAMIPVTP